MWPLGLTPAACPSLQMSVANVESRNITRDVESGAAAPLRVEELLCFALYVTARASEASYRPVLGPLGLTYPRYIVLVVLAEQDSLTVSDLGARLHLDSGTLTPLIKGLEADGQVTRQRDREDERLVRVTLTEKGRELTRIAIKAAHSVACAIDMSAADVKRIRDDVNKVFAALRGAQATGGA